MASAREVEERRQTIPDLIAMHGGLSREKLLARLRSVGYKISMRTLDSDLAELRRRVQESKALIPLERQGDLNQARKLLTRLRLMEVRGGEGWEPPPKYVACVVSLLRWKSEVLGYLGDEDEEGLTAHERLARLDAFLKERADESVDRTEGADSP